MKCEIVIGADGQAYFEAVGLERPYRNSISLPCGIFPLAKFV